MLGRDALGCNNRKGSTSWVNFIKCTSMISKKCILFFLSSPLSNLSASQPPTYPWGRVTSQWSGLYGSTVVLITGRIRFLDVAARTREVVGVWPGGRGGGRSGVVVRSRGLRELASEIEIQIDIHFAILIPNHFSFWCALPRHCKDLTTLSC